MKNPLPRMMVISLIKMKSLKKWIFHS